MQGRWITSFTVMFVLVSVAHAGQTSVPDQPLGMKGMVDPSRRAFTLLWEPVAQAADGSELKNLAGYNVYRRTTPRGHAVKINSYILPIPVYADRLDGAVGYYSVRAVDTLGNESEESLLVDSSEATNVIFVSNDAHTDMVIPGNLADVLRPSHNRYGVPLQVVLKEQSRSIDSAVVRSICFQLLRGDTKEEVNDITFPTSGAEIRVGYNESGGQVAFGPPTAQASGVASVTNATPDQLSLYWFNGVVWVKIGGVHNKATQTVDVKSSQLGRYELRIASPSNALTLNKANVFPGILTPNKDGFNDRIYMVLENPNNAAVQAKIFDVSGRYVATLPPPQTAGIGTTLVWAGQDATGSTVPSGLYVYRIEGDGQTLTGTVSVAR